MPDIWFIGNKDLRFAAPQLRQLQKLPRGQKLFMDNNYELHMYCKSEGYNRSWLGRIRNCFAKAVNEIMRMPAYLFILLDDGILEELHISTVERSMALLTTEIQCNFEARYELLPTKVKPITMPTTFLIDPLVKHVDHDQYKFF